MEKEKKMKIIDQWGGEHYAHSIEINQGNVRCVPDSDHRRKEKLGVYSGIERAAQIQAEIYCANCNGKLEYTMPAE